jgi:predicted nucleotidyltransferase component of viral defense system
MDFSVFKDKLVAEGYSEDTAYAKIAHDIVIKAVRDSGFHDNLTVKGGVVMSSLTNVARRATMDMDLDFLRYPLTNEGIRKFVVNLNRVAPCRMQMAGKIETLKQQEYKGKRVRLALTDETGFSIETKIDVGVHTRADVEQSDWLFKVVTDDDAVALLANSREQIFVEKLKSLLRFGSASTRFKDIYDMYYLSKSLRLDVVQMFLKSYVYEDAKMQENAISDVEGRLRRIFANKTFMRNLSKPANAWLNETADRVADQLILFVSTMK